MPVQLPERIRNADDTELARALGFFSLGLGSAQLLAPRVVNWIAGVDNRPRNRMLQRAVGARELAAGIAIFGQTERYPGLWARVAGDAMDLALLGSALVTKRSKRVRVLVATTVVAGVTAADIAASSRLARKAGRVGPDGALRARSAITINRPVEEVYAVWRNFANLPGFMAHLEAVETDGETRSHWRAAAPAGGTVEWDAEIVVEIPNELLAWGSVDGTGIENAGSVRFAPAPRDQGTEVTVELEYKPPAGPVGAVVAKLLGEAPSQQIKDDLRRFKQIMETGEVVVSDGSPEGTLTRRQFVQREAQPVAQ